MTWGHAASVLTHRVGSPCQHPTLCLGEGVHALASVSPQPLLQASLLSAYPYTPVETSDLVDVLNIETFQ